MPSQSLAVRVALAFGFASGLLLTGCGSVPFNGGATVSQLSMQGSVHGGRQPIVGAQVDLIAAGTSGYGVGSVSLLSSGPVLSSSTGSFSLTGDFSCPSANAQVYIIASGGDTGGGINPKSVLMAALGNCGDLTPSTYIVVNEVSTVASVFSLAPFMTPGSTAVGTSATNTLGLTNAFKTVANLMDSSTGVARGMTKAGNGVVPQAKINALADLLVSCVNTTGDTPRCSSLFAAATPPGGSAPADTLAAILDIALNPGNNVADLFSPIAAVAPYQPALATAPNDWTIAISYTGGDLNAPLLPAVDASGNVWVPNGASSPGKVSMFSPTGSETTITGGGLALPFSVAVDTDGNLWTANSGNSSVSKHAANGAPLSGTSGFSIPGSTTPEAVALDGSGHVFVVSSNSTITELNAAGTSLAQFINGGLNIPYGVAIDSSENVWTANRDGNSASKFSNTGVPYSTTGFSGGGIARPYWVAIDANDNAWLGNFDSSSVTKLSSAGVPASGGGFATPAGVTALAIDGANSVWTANRDGSVSHLSNSGASLSPAAGYQATGSSIESGIVVDGSGNVWVTDLSNTLFEYVGAAAPAVVPLQAAVKNGQIGQRP